MGKARDDPSTALAAAGVATTHMGRTPPGQKRNKPSRFFASRNKNRMKAGAATTALPSNGNVVGNGALGHAP